MTKLNIKKLEKEIENLMNNFGIKREYRNAFGWQLKDLIKQVVESVPVEVTSREALVELKTLSQEIKQWKKKMLEVIER